MHKNPYDIDVHRGPRSGSEPCPIVEGANIPFYEWDERQNRFAVIDHSQIDEHNCSACEYLWGLYKEWEQWTPFEDGSPGDPRELAEAFSALSYESYFATFEHTIRPSEVSLQELRWIEIVRSERARFRAEQDYIMWVRSQQKA